MKLDKFVGREKELGLLNGLLKKDSASFVAVKGRRRIGKSRLIREFGENCRFISLSGVAPVKGITPTKQRKAFAEQLAQKLHIPEPKSDNWTNLFAVLSNQLSEGRVILLLDEISWLAHRDSSFQVKLKNAWDDGFKNNPELILVVCSSISSWIEDNIINSTAFVGRLSLTLHLQPLSLTECSEFWGTQKKHVSAHEKFKVLAVTGGIPRYLEEIDPSQSAEANIKRLCFMKEGVLFGEFKHIFHDLFGSRSATYSAIVEALIKHPSATLDDIYEFLKVEKQGVISSYLSDLEHAGFIRRSYTWNFKTGITGKRRCFSISDNYLRFYLKYIAPNMIKIEKGDYDDVAVESLPAWNSIMGLQFENLVINNRKALLNVLRISPSSIINDGPYIQFANQAQEGCQVDYLIEDKFRTLIVIEVKFSIAPVQLAVVDEVKQKLEKLRGLENVSYRPVLIHVNGVDDSVVNSGFFAQIVNFSEFLK